MRIGEMRESKVAILYSSSLNSFKKRNIRIETNANMSQSFIHQVLIPSKKKVELKLQKYLRSQSFIHQVLIPSESSKSGLPVSLIRRNPLFIKS